LEVECWFLEKAGTECVSIVDKILHMFEGSWELERSVLEGVESLGEFEGKV
jgi:hypothetical protein